MSLPDRRPATIGQPTYQPEPISGHVELYNERVPIAYVQDPLNPQMSVAIDARLLRVPARAEAPVVVYRGVDPRAQVLAAGGVFAAGVGWGVGEVVSAFAGINTGSLIAAGVVLGVFKLPAAFARRPRITNNTTVNNTNRWLGRSTTNTHQR